MKPDCATKAAWRWVVMVVSLLSRRAPFRKYYVGREMFAARRRMLQRLHHRWSETHEESYGASAS